MPFLIINNDRIYCAEKSESILNFQSLGYEVRNPDNVQAVRRIPRIYTNGKKDNE